MDGASEDEGEEWSGGEARIQAAMGYALTGWWVWEMEVGKSAVLAWGVGKGNG